MAPRLVGYCGDVGWPVAFGSAAKGELYVRGLFIDGRASRCGQWPDASSVADAGVAGEDHGLDAVGDSELGEDRG